MTRKMLLNLPEYLLTVSLFSVASAGLSTAGTALAKDTAGDVSRGAISWSQNCGRCHELRNPTEFRDDLWKPIVTHMRVRAGLTGQQQRDILAFLQASNNPAPLKTAVSESDETPAGRVLSGREVYDLTCVACHGADGSGAMPGTPDFTAPDGPLSKSDAVLIQHITQGFQTPGSPMAMPAMGGNPDLNAADVHAVLEYMRTTFGSR